MWSPAGLSLLLFPAEALRPHQLFGQRAAAVFWTGKAELTFCTFHPPKTVHVASPSSLVNEELKMRYRFTFWLKLFVKLWAKRWSYSECCCLRRCSSLLVCCALILAGPVASQWSGKKLCWRREYLCFGGACTAEIISSETFETISESRDLRA